MIVKTAQDTAAFEMEINDWLSQNPNIRIIQMLQTTQNAPKGWNLIITLLYEK